MDDDLVYLDLTLERPAVSSIAERAYDLMAPLARRDATDGWPLLFLLDAFTLGEAPIWELVEDPGLDEFLQVDVAPAEWLPWLAAVVGARLAAAMTEAQRRLEIRHPSGYERGRPRTIAAMIDGHLTGQRAVIFREKFDGNAYHLVIRTRADETPDPAAVLADLKRNVPTALRLDYAAAAEREWIDVEETWATWADLEDMTWEDVNVV